MPHKDPEARKACDKRRREKNKERKAAVDAAYYSANKDVCLAKAAVRYQQNKEAVRARSKAWYENNKERARAAHKAWALAHPEQSRQRQAQWSKLHPDRRAATTRKSRFGITPRQYAALKTAFPSCGICGKPPASKSLDIDHDHLTGEVRGLLCNNCNQGIGHLKDSPNNLRAAAVYLEQAAADAAVRAVWPWGAASSWGASWRVS